MSKEINYQTEKKQWTLYGVMQRFLKLTKFYLGYVFYVLITVNERTNYLQAEQRGYGLIDLIENMGLSKNEWGQIKSKSNLDITDAEMQEVEEHFSKKVFT